MLYKPRTLTIKLINSRFLFRVIFSGVSIVIQNCFHWFCFTTNVSGLETSRYLSNQWDAKHLPPRPSIATWSLPFCRAWRWYSVFVSCFHWFVVFCTLIVIGYGLAFVLFGLSLSSEAVNKPQGKNGRITRGYIFSFASRKTDWAKVGPYSLSIFELHISSTKVIRRKN